MRAARLNSPIRSFVCQCRHAEEIDCPVSTDTQEERILSAAPKEGLRRKEKTALGSMLGRPPCPSGGLVFAIILDILEDLVWEVQLPVDVAGIRIVGVRTDRE